MEQRIDQSQEPLEHKLLAAFRDEKLDRIAAQTRTLVRTNLGTVGLIAGLAFALLRVG